jgi:multidrug efflux pump subunit AcrA (membrane-fusion protein)
MLLIPPAVVLIAAIALAGAWRLGLVTLPTNPFAKSSNGVHDNGATTSLYTVTRRDLSSQTEVNGALGYAGSYSAVNQDSGPLTALPSVGEVVSQGQVLYQVSGSPVVLLYGSTPAYRALSAGLTGADVLELNADLVALGYVSSSHLSPTSDQFTSWTEYGVDKLQAALGEQTGTLPLGQVVFLPSAARITAVQGTLGAQAGTGQPLLTASSTTRQVTVNLDAGQQAEIAVGDQVEINLPNGKSTPGTVTSVGTVATSPSGGGSPTIPVLITPTDPAATGTLDQATVEVYITTANVKNALVVPIAALLAQAGGTYAVEVVNPNRVHHLVPVSLGLFDDADGLVQVTNTSLQAGDRIVEAGT